jgi:Prokaryotic E2 family C/ThiF family
MLADWFARSAVAAAQVLEGFDEERFGAHLEGTVVGVSANAPTQEGDALLDMLVRLVARLYPTLALVVPGESGERLADLSRAINPRIELVDSADLGIVVGDGAPFSESIYASSDGWDALLGSEGPISGGETANPFGAGAAACFAAAALFRRVFLPDWAEWRDEDLCFSTFASERLHTPGPSPALPPQLGGDAVLVGAGAIGHGALWALSRLPVAGRVHVVDPERIELSNMQRYVLSERRDEDAAKATLATRTSAGLKFEPCDGGIAEFVGARGYQWPAMLLALDSARDRLSAQASLPAWIANAWTQTGDLGVASHSRFGGDGACVGCMYLPDAAVKNEDQLVAEALGIPHLLMQVRVLLYTGRGVERDLLQAVAQAIGRPLEALLPFEGRTIRELYVEGFCGGQVIPLGQAGKLANDAQEMHVPLAHQSALAGVLLAAALIRRVIEGVPELTSVTRIDVMRPLGSHVTQPLRARRDGRCICDDQDFNAAYAAKYLSPGAP